jgi:hypothetical protein
MPRFDDFFARATWRGADELRQHLHLGEFDFRSAAGFSHEDARAFYLYTALDEVQKASVAIRQWSEFLGGAEEVDESEQLNRVLLEAVLDEQDFRHRRLLEVLIELICFRTTNEQKYYSHYMLLQNFQRESSVVEDYRTFYGFSSARLQAQAEMTWKWIDSLESSTFEISRCWYSRHRKRLPRTARPGEIFSSARSRLREALSQASEHEKMVLGFSYYEYSRASVGVHFQASHQRLGEKSTESVKGISMLGVLALNCLAAAQKLIGVVPDGLNRDMTDSLQGKEVVQIFESTVGNRGEAGDFVLAYNEYLAEILEAKTNEFGYQSYRVKILDDQPPWSLTEDWLPPQEVLRLDEVNQLVQATRGKMIEEKVTDEGSIEAAVRQSTLHIWKHGFREAVLSRLRGGGGRGETPPPEEPRG